MLKKKLFSFRANENSLEVLKRHGLNISEVLNEALDLKAKMIVDEESTEERKKKLQDQINLLDKQMERQAESDKVIEKLIGDTKERYEKILDILRRQVEEYGFLSLPEVHRLCDLNKINYNEFLLEIPIEWDSLKTERALAEITENKPYRDEDGKTQYTGYL